jgi:hypothetical protein
MQVLETRRGCIDSAMTAFDYLRQGGVAWGTGGEVCLLLVVVVTAPTQKKPN